METFGDVNLFEEFTSDGEIINERLTVSYKATY